MTSLSNIIAAFSLFLLLQVAANPLLSEFMADNKSTIADDDGAFSDWIEIHNPTNTPIDLSNWYLTDSATNLTKWRFPVLIPAITITPGDFLIVWASSKNKKLDATRLHTNFSLNNSGEYLALVRPDGSTVQQAFAPQFPSQAADESYGSRFNSTVLLAPGAAGRYFSPQNAGQLPVTWNQLSFNDTAWPSGPSGYGYGLNLPGITVKQISKIGQVGGLVDALNLITLPANDPSISNTTSTVMPVLNLLGDGSGGNFINNVLPPGNGGDNYVIVANGNIVIPVAGVYTFGINSDDGSQLLIDDNEIIRDDAFHAPQTTIGSVNLTAGSHSFRVVMFEGGGGDCVEFFAAPGAFTNFDPQVFRLVGDVSNGGLAAETTPVSAGGLVGTDLATTMAGSSSALVRMPFITDGAGTATSLSMVMRYSDGFSTWLNGAAAAKASVPSPLRWDSLATSTFSNAQALQKRGYNLTSMLPSLVNGTNTLAIHGIKSTLADTLFLTLPQLIKGNLNTVASPAFYSKELATPGWINGNPSSLGMVADTSFSAKRGFYVTPITLAITSTTPAAVIRYTLDGSPPSDTHGTVYTAPLSISSTTVVRAIATLPGWRSTNIDTHTYLFLNDVITQSANGTAPLGWPTVSGTSQVLDYGMDPTIVGNVDPLLGGAPSVKAALASLPSISVTTDLPNLFNIGGSQGIFSNPYGRGYAWERPASVEWINPPDSVNPNGKGEFQIDAGLRIRGGFSRSEDNPKHAIRLFFRQEYGAAKLKYPIFGRDAAQEFDKIDLRTAQNYSWSFAGDTTNTFLREEATRQAQLDMGQPGSHVQYAHLYLNGQYWGLYSFDERKDAGLAESYLGGTKDEYDVVKADQANGYTIEPTDGNLLAWQELWNKGKTHRASPTDQNYFKLMGLAANGITPTTDPVLLDVDNLIDYLLLTFWSGNFDGCVSSFLDNERANNWFGSRRRDNNMRQGFKFYVHDFEHCMFDRNEDRTGPFPSLAETEFIYSNPLFLHQDLIENAEYRMRWADRIQRHLFNNGALTPSAWQNRINQLASKVDAAIIAESARWGDAKTSPPRTKSDWLGAQNDLINYLTPRHPIVLAQLRADRLYPTLDAPILAPSGGYQPSNTSVSVSASTGAEVFYMADGSDPRLVGGGIRPGAIPFMPGSLATETLVPFSASGWKYLGDGSDQGTAWRAATYNDGTWPTGAAELGYGDGDENTVIPIVDISPNIPGIQKPATCYFRKTFTVSQASQITSLELKVEYDDAFAVYLNGTHIGGNLPENPSYNFYTGETSIDDTLVTLSVPAGLLQSGSNIIAVEIHQSNDASSDISMNLSLSAVRNTSGNSVLLSGTGERTLRMRAKNGATWSALAEAVYQIGTVPPSPANLVISEISYHPPDPNGDAEFIELLNTSASEIIDLGRVRFIRGIDFTFPANTSLAAGERILVIKNNTAFEVVYGTGKPIAGNFENATTLSNAGERITLEGKAGNILIDFTYSSTFPWPPAANGLGRSIVLTNYSNSSNPSFWRPSTQDRGNPGSSDSLPLALGQDLLAYAFISPDLTLNPANGDLTISRRLGADAVTLTPQWSTDLQSWSALAITLTADSLDSPTSSALKWRLDPLPPHRGFFRILVVKKP